MESFARDATSLGYQIETLIARQNAALHRKQIEHAIVTGGLNIKETRLTLASAMLFISASTSHYELHVAVGGAGNYVTIVDTINDTSVSSPFSSKDDILPRITLAIDTIMDLVELEKQGRQRLLNKFNGDLVDFVRM